MEIERMPDPTMGLDVDAKPDVTDDKDTDRDTIRANCLAIVNDICADDPPADPQTGPQLCGFYNLGNTCYQNSIIQCLINNRLLVHRLREHVTATTTDDNDTNHSTEEPDESVAKVVLELRDEYEKSTDAIRTEKLRQLVSRDYQWTVDGAQHDSQEYLMVLLDLIHEKTRKLAKKAKCADSGDQSELEWQRVQATEGVSPISDSFRGQMRAKVTCQQCLGETATFEPFMYLCLPLPVSIEADVRVRVHRPDGDHCDAVLTTENKFLSVFSLRSQIRERYFPDTDESDLLLAERTRVIDQSEEISAFLNKTIDCYQLNPLNRLTVDDSSGPEADELGLASIGLLPLSHPSAMIQCPICLDELDTSVLLAHDLCGGAICRNCLPQLVAHSNSSRFQCCTCALEVTEHDFRPLDNPNSTVYVIPVLINDWLMIRVTARMKANDLYSLIDTKIPLSYVQNEWKLLFTDKESNCCSKCLTNCSGCEVARNGVIQLLPSDAIKVVFTDRDRDHVTQPSNELVDWPVPTVLPALPPIPTLNGTITATTDPTVDSPNADSHTLTLDQCFNSFIQNESLETEIFCEKCRQMTKSLRRLSVERAPSTLIVHLKRFLFFDNKCHKITDKISFPEELDLKPILSDDKSGGDSAVRYHLLALVLHNGSSNNGHYLAQIRAHDRWYLCDDHRVSEQTPDLDDSRAYILFYLRQDFKQFL